jgi:crotonobetainyl-CoA:carnitine CoA-transferase CaiB-like acyl-CoA transferase
MALVFAAHTAGERVARGDQRLAGRYACYRVYECKDGRHYSVAALEPKFWKALCEGIDRPDLLEAQFSEDLAVQEDMERIFRSRSRDEWESKLAPLDACCEPVLDVDEVASHPQVVARRLLQGFRDGRAPDLGQHTEEVLSEIGL